MIQQIDWRNYWFIASIITLSLVLKIYSIIALSAHIDNHHCLPHKKQHHTIHSAHDSLLDGVKHFLN